MKIDIDIDKRYEEIQVILRSNEMNDETIEILEKLKTTKNKYILGKSDKKVYIVDVKDIYFSIVKIKKYLLRLKILDTK